MTKKKMVKVEMELPLMEGYEYTGELRTAVPGEYFLRGGGSDVAQLLSLNGTTSGVYPIMRPIANWREARPSDLENGPVVCRYSDDSQEIETNPEIGYFCGYDAIQGTEYPFAVMDEKDAEEPDRYYRYCQVKDNA